MTTNPDTDKTGPDEVETLPEPPSPDNAAPKLDRSLSWIGAVGLAFTITNSWMSYAATFGTSLVYGGGLTVLFAVIIAATAQWIVLIGLSELTSAIPSSGGCYHFTYFLAPEKTRKFASFTIGIINLMGFWIGGVSAMIYTTISVFGMVSFWIEDFTPLQWQVYLAYIGVICLSLIPIFTIPRAKTKYMTTTSLGMSLSCLVLFIIVLLAMGRGQYQPRNLILHRNRSGWSDSSAWLLSISLGQYSFSAAGTVVHLAEEVPRPRRNIPLAINTTMLIGVSTAIPFIIVLLSGIQDLDAVQDAWIPSTEAFYQATGSKVVATFLQTCLALLYFTTVSTQWVSVSRIAWTLSRDNVLPFSKYWNHIDPTLGFPVRTTLLSAGFCVVFGLIYIASTTAFNSVVNMTTLLVNIAFTVPQGILACGRRDRLPPRQFHLGRRVGYVVNIFSVCWLVFSGVLFCFPTRIPTTPGSMNYGAAVLFAILLSILISYILRRNSFHGPRIPSLEAT
ncbi:amino acid/polyamine transporter I [Aspergillus cavernicola]|uniref:Amino acid/polyamine transporter I n=1 Tax=Aspergillus cavernicola TaxID=176166 RepID=A0ABR4IXL1_9EURO